MAETFAAIERDFLQITSEVVWCTVTTVDGAGRPRSRVLHPIFEAIDDRAVGWVLTARTEIKTRHLAANPHVVCSYWSPAQNVAYADCTARWVEDDATKRHVFELFRTTPPPLGYDVSGYGPDEHRSASFTPLRLDPWRIQVFRFGGWDKPILPRLWRAEELAPRSPAPGA